ncbi:MAG: hypothetical protein N2D54_01525 [Chloroflexota bacterium]
MKQQYNEQDINLAWQHIEHEIKSAEEVSPTSGFVNRFKSRLAERRMLEERRDAFRVAFFMTLAAIIILSILVWLGIATYDSLGEFFIAIVNVFSRALINLQMVIGVVASMGRTLPTIVPLSWITSIFVGVAGIMAVWISSVKQHLPRIGVSI